MLLDVSESQLVLVDYQARLMPAIFEGPLVLANALRLAQMARSLDVPQGQLQVKTMDEAYARFYRSGDNTATLTIFMLEQWLLVATTGNSVGHLITGIRVRRLDGNYVGILPALVRIGLILLVIPAVIWDSDNRGLHDKAARTVLVRR